MRTPRRLPGFAFETVTPPIVDTLPRMDVSAFVGFASCGPIHCPVSVEEPAYFQEMFGDDPELAFDAELNEMVTGNLGPCVRSFFKNGGRRCWIVRVADRATAETSSFPIPGLYRYRDGVLTQANAQARSPGSWADAFEVAVELDGTALGVTGFSLDPLFIDLAVERPNTVNAGDLLRVQFRGEGFSLMFRGVAVNPLGTAGGTRSGVIVRVSGADLLCAQTAAADSPGAWSSTVPGLLGGALPSAEVVTFALIVRKGEQNIERINGLGFTADHSLFWADLPTDAALCSPSHAPISDSILAVAVNPRFALAGDMESAALYVPVGMPYVLTDYVRGNWSKTTALVRDGLATFNSALFLDRDLVDPDVLSLMSEADFIRYQSPEPRSLIGIHAVLSLCEATLVAVPDASHRGWELGTVPDVPVPQPSELIPHPEWWHFEPCSPAAIVKLSDQPEWGNFLNCNLLVLAAPVLQSSASGPNGSFLLQWTSTGSGYYILEEALNADWSDATVIYEGDAPRYFVPGRHTGAYYYRVRVTQACVTSNWSNGIVVAVARQGEYFLCTEADYNPRTLLDVQRSLLRAAGARGDLFAVLSLPEHYREQDTLSHAARLKAESDDETSHPLSTGSPDSATFPIVRPLSGLDQKALSYGALYHSWLIGQEEGDTSSMPPDGAVCGVFAGKALRRGAWIAPANQPLDSIIALQYPLAQSRWLDLLESQVNVTQQDPHGFLWMSADTLSGDPDVRPINVRRLLILLRRLALQQGAFYVFEPNSDAFARLVKHSFENLLGTMYERGAFAGDTPEQSFRVVTDSTVNTPRARDDGQFYVELRVAPSLPMQFLTVRLVQTADRAVVTEVS